MYDDAADKSAGATLVTGARWVVAWDPDSGGHVYRTGADVVFEDGVLIHVGPDYAGRRPGPSTPPAAWSCPASWTSTPTCSRSR